MCSGRSHGVISYDRDGDVLSSPGPRALLVVHHTTSPSLQAMLEAVLDGAQTEEIKDVDVRVRPALAATAVDVLSADAFLLGTSANIGYMSGALKHFFDQIYYPCLTAKVGAGYGVYIHGNSDTEGALRAIRSIVAGLGWVAVHEPVTVLGTPGRADLEACWDLGATTAAMPASFIAAAASSRLEPQPKFKPPTMISPRFTFLGKSSSNPTIRWLAISPGS